MSVERLMSEGQTSGTTQSNSVMEPVANGFELAADQLGAGAMLRQAREARGLHIAALAVLLKVPVKKLEALESDRFDLLPDAVFVRALASSVCRTLKVDPAEILARLPQTSTSKLSGQDAGINEPFRSHGDRAGPSVWAQLSRPAVIAGFLLLLGAVVLIFLPTIKNGLNIVGLESAVVKINNPLNEKDISAVTAVQSTAAGLQYAGQSPPAAPGVGAVSLESVPAVDIAGANAEASLSAKSTVTAGAAEPLADIVTFTAKTESWVEVADARGQVVLRRILAAGEVVGASGALPLKVIVGRADSTQVQIRGKVFDVNAVAKDNVAKFEVK